MFNSPQVHVDTNALRQQRGEIHDQMVALLNKAESAGRDLSKAEDKEYSDLDNQYKALGRRIERAENTAGRDAEINGTTEPVIRPELGTESVKDTGWRNRDGSTAKVVAKGDKLSGAPGIGVADVMAGMLNGPHTPEVRAALEEGTDAAGGFTVPTTLMERWIDDMRPASRVFQAGARTLLMRDGEVQMVRVDTVPTASWRAESALIAESDPVFSVVTFKPKDLALRIRVSRELVLDTANLLQMLPILMNRAMAEGLDTSCLFGAGGVEPTGLLNAAGVQELSLGTNGAPLVGYGDMFDALALSHAVNSEPNAAIMAPRTWDHYARLVDSTGQPLQRPAALDGISMLPTNKVATDMTQGTASDASAIFMGDFTQMMVGIRETARLEIHRDTRAEYGEVVFIAHLRADVALLQPSAFVNVTGIIPAA